MQVFNLLNNERFVHAFKTALACLLGVLITKFAVHLPADQWLVVTIIVVMCAQMNVGGMLQKSYMRFLGTISGSLISIIVLQLFGPEIIAITATITIAAFIFSYLATSDKSYSEAGTLGAATVVIILLSTHPTLTIAIERFIEITLGIIIAVVISQFILPIHARTRLRYNQANTLLQFKDYYQKFTSITNLDQIETANLDDDIIQSLLKQRTLAKEAKRELLGTLFDAEHYLLLLKCERDMLRAISFMHYAYVSSSEVHQFLMRQSAMTPFNNMICEQFIKLHHCLQNKIPLVGACNSLLFTTLQQQIMTEKNTLSPDAQVKVDGFLFSVGVLVERLQCLEKLLI